MTSSSRRRRLALVGLAVLAVLVVVLVYLRLAERGTAEEDGGLGPGPRHPEAEAAADWLAGQLEGGTVRDEERGEVDQGLAIDTALALDEVGGHQEQVAEVVDALERGRVAYTIRDRERLPGPSAKALLLLLQQGGDPAGLQRTLEGLASTDPAFPGRLRNSTLDTMGDVEGQAYGARSLADAGSRRTGDVVDFLLAQQCEEGYFRATFASLESADQTCDGGRGRPDAEATALVLLLVGPLAGEVEGVQPAMRSAAAWLVSRAGDDGLLPGGSLSGLRADVPSAVATGIAARALGGWGETEAAARSAAALRDLQLTSGLDRGAIAPDPGRLAAGEASGLGVPPPTDWRRATALAAGALTWLDD